MTLDLEQIRSCNPIEEMVAEKFALKKSGSRFVGVKHVVRCSLMPPDWMISRWQSSRV